MTGTEERDREFNSKGLAEFETGGAGGLALFEDDCSILLDEFPDFETIVIDELSITDMDEFENSPDDENEETEPDDPDQPDDDSEKPDESEAEIEDTQDIEDIEPAADEVVEPLPPEDEPVEPEPHRPQKLPGPVIGFVCEKSTNLSSWINQNRRMTEFPGVVLIGVSCAGMIKPAWLKLALDRGASGTFVVKCAPGSCHYRTGSETIERRLRGETNPSLPPDTNLDRVRLFECHPAAGNAFRDRIIGFLFDLAELEAETNLQE